ncbi:MAG: alpha/beta fold hydrolase [Phaeodactylibacter sp.]|nr:alpha/beta fold hydrolase [Phaeodactylibacter sp.]
MQDFAENPDGYWLFTPADPVPETAPVVVFMHGYGGYNPMIYGKWIKHLVRQGNIVIYPRYQRNMISPKPDDFADNAAQGLRDALAYLKQDTTIRADMSVLPYVGHSYGGVISSELAIYADSVGLPPASVVMMCSPGTSWMDGGRLESYAGMPENLLLLGVVSQDDEVTADEFAIKVFNEAVHVEKRRLLRQYADHHGTPGLTAGHNLTYSVDLDLDAGFRNYTSRRALRISTLDPMDYNGYWKWFDALLDCSRSGEHCDWVYGDHPEVTSLGNWTDGTPIRPMELAVPAIPTPESEAPPTPASEETTDRK